jgi:hypothetical protein
VGIKEICKGTSSKKNPIIGNIAMQQMTIDLRAFCYILYPRYCPRGGVEKQQGYYTIP